MLIEYVNESDTAKEIGKKTTRKKFSAEYIMIREY